MAKQVATSPMPGKRQRSPNFPALALEDALKRAQIVYEKDRRASISGTVILEHLGYGKKISGSAGRVLSALRQYALLDDTADDKYRISDNAYLILTLPGDSAKRWEAIQKAATNPAAFRDVLKKYPEGLPSDSALREYLIAERGFNADSIELFIRALKTTITFAKLDQGAYHGPDDEVPLDLSRNLPDPAKSPATGVSREVSSLAEGEAVLQWPASISPESVQDLEDWLSLVLKKLKRRTKD